MPASPRLAFTADAMLLAEPPGAARWHTRPYVELDATGTITTIAPCVPDELPNDIVLYDLGPRHVLPGFVNAHSHAFQRSIRGLTGQRGSGDPSSFWSWRTAMYSEALRLDPERFFAVTRACYREMLRTGITCVGEFHYVHHQPDGTPYDDANELSHAVIAAASEVGMRLTLLEVYYARAGHSRGPLPEQRRFCDASVDTYLARVDTLRAKVDPTRVRIGLAPHSVRAVPKDDLQAISLYARQHDLVVHAHVSEQQRENDECREEHGCTPTELFAEAELLAAPRRFTAVHAIHVTSHDYDLLASQHVCACPSTEADLGDGIIPASDFLRAGARLCLGSDSNAIIDLVQEARLLEMGERLRRMERLCLTDKSGRVAPVLIDAATLGGASALGWYDLGVLAIGRPFDAVAMDRTHVSLREVPDEAVADALMLAGSSAPVAHVYVAGEQRV